jgi:hypothetical protein
MGFFPAAAAKAQDFFTQTYPLPPNSEFGGKFF